MRRANHNSSACSSPLSSPKLRQFAQAALALARLSSSDEEDICATSKPRLSDSVVDVAVVLRLRHHRRRLMNTINPSLTPDAAPLSGTSEYHGSSFQHMTGNPMNPCDASLIMEHVYLGCVRSSQDRRKLQRLRIGYLIVCSRTLPEAFSHELKYFRVPVEDTTSANIAQYFDRATAFIERARHQKQNILVHCQQGMSRSASIVIAWLIRFHGLSLHNAYWLSKKRRHCVSPNPSFMLQLAEYEKQIAGAGFPDCRVDRDRASWRPGMVSPGSICRSLVPGFENVGNDFAHFDLSEAGRTNNKCKVRDLDGTGYDRLNDTNNVKDDCHSYDSKLNQQDVVGDIGCGNTDKGSDEATMTGSVRAVDIDEPESEPFLDPYEYAKGRYGMFWPDKFLDETCQYMMWCKHILDNRGYVQDDDNS